METEFDRILREHFQARPMAQKILLDRFPDLDHSHLEAAYEIAQDLLRHKKYDDAESVFYFLAMMDHFERRYWKALAVTLWVQKKYKDALGVYLAAFFLDPMDIEVVAAMADCCLAMGDREGAKEFLEQTCEIFEIEGKRGDLARRAKVFLEMIEQKNGEKNGKS
ncbi:MAG: tetratricopeptide repeat protein [Puniceicoccales bacterium]|jgi:type III secretion system low calcium response chaperone LcrH/SycD|nr:tetratricopeptide repeat protein [Puniceicoccales bacterium]